VEKNEEFIPEGVGNRSRDRLGMTGTHDTALRG
jgi:hypothetical protein